MSHAHTPTTTLPGQITWRCGTCQKPAHTGGIHIDLQEIRAVERAVAAWERSKSGVDAPAMQLGDIIRMPPLARWRIDCDRCRHDCSGCYMIELTQCRSAFALLRWTDHLHGKSWFNATDWIRFAATTARENGSPFETTGVW